MLSKNKVWVLVRDSTTEIGSYLIAQLWLAGYIQGSLFTDPQLTTND